VIELSGYVWEALARDEEFILYRGRGKDDPSQAACAALLNGKLSAASTNSRLANTTRPTGY
jgi:hypothetical protein